MRDMADCIVQGFLSASGDPDLQKKVFEKDKEFIGTEYASKGNWRIQDVFKIDLSTIDPLAVIQNTMCFVEHYMGVYPNVGNIESVDEFLKEL